MEQDLGILLENNFLSFIRTLGIFFVGSIALLHFVKQGQFFSLVSLTIALILAICVVSDYFVERARITRRGFSTRLIIDILAYVMILFIVMLIFLIHSVYYTNAQETEISFSTLVKEIENVGERISTTLKGGILGPTSQIVDKGNVRQAVNAVLASVA